MKIIIIEDEIFTAEDLRDDLQAINPAIEVLAILPTVKESIQYFSKNHDYDLIFSDIQLGDGQSFEIFKQVSVAAPIIFCTAYNQYALEAFKANGIDYILKPFDKNSIVQALNKYQILKEKLQSPAVNYENILALLKPQSNHIQSLIVHQADKIIPLSLSEIALIYLKNQVIHLHTFAGKEYHIYQTLDELEQKLNPQFYRVNRQFLVNRKAINDVSQYFGRKLLLNLSFNFPEQLTISKEKTTHFLEWLAEN